MWWLLLSASRRSAAPGADTRQTPWLSHILDGMRDSHGVDSKKDSSVSVETDEHDFV